LPSFDTPRRNPELPRRPEGINGLSIPPGLLVSEAMNVSVIDAYRAKGPGWQYRLRGDRDHRGDLVQSLADLPLRNLNVEIIL